MMSKQTTGAPVDPITLAVVRGALETAQREMTLTLERPAAPASSTWRTTTATRCSTITRK